MNFEPNNYYKHNDNNTLIHTLTYLKTEICSESVLLAEIFYNGDIYDIIVLEQYPRLDVCYTLIDKNKFNEYREQQQNN